MKIKFLVFIFHFIFLNCQNNINTSNVFPDFDLKKTLSLSSLIENIKYEKNKMKFLAKEDIPKNQELFTIPYNLMFNVSKALELINSKTLNKQHKEFEKLNLTNSSNPNDFRKEEAFLSYIFYLISHRQKKYKNTKFYENYQKYIELLQKYSPKSPLFYDQDETGFLAGTNLDRELDFLKKIYQDEIDIFISKSYMKKVIDSDEYMHLRLAIKKYGLNILNHWTLVPFLNYLDDDYTNYNSYYSVQKNGDLKIISNKEIKKGNEIILQVPKMTNIKRLLFEGKTYEELVNYFEKYEITAFSPALYYQYGINDKDYFQNFYVNILDKDFEEQFSKIYIDHQEMLNGDGHKLWVYDLIDMNINFYKEHFQGITQTKIFEIFYDKDTRVNIDRIIRGERKIIEDVYDNVSVVIDKLIEEEQKIKRQKRMEEAKRQAEEAEKLAKQEKENKKENDNKKENENKKEKEKVKEKEKEKEREKSPDL